MIQYFAKPFRSFGGNINVNVDLSNYATKADMKNISHVDTSTFALKTNLASLKTEVHKLDIERLAPVPADLSKLSDVVKNDVVQKAVYEKLAAKVNDIDASDSVLKTKYQTDKTELEKKIPDVTDFVKETKLTELENKIPNVSSLATKAALTAVENKIPSVSSLVKKTDYNTKITEIEKKLTDHNHDKYITTPEFNTLAASVFNARLAQANLITKTDLDTKLKNNLKSTNTFNGNENNQLKKLSLDNFLGRLLFDGEDGLQNYLVFQPIHKYFKTIAGVGNGSYIYYWKSKGLSDERINSIKTPHDSITPNLNYYDTRTRVEFNESCFKQDEVIFNHEKVVNSYIVYEISKSINISSYFD